MKLEPGIALKSGTFEIAGEWHVVDPRTYCAALLFYELNLDTTLRQHALRIRTAVVCLPVQVKPSQRDFETVAVIPEISSHNNCLNS